MLREDLQFRVISPKNTQLLVKSLKLPFNGFTTDSTVYDFLSMHNGVWPNGWLTRYPHLNSISLPSLIPNRRDLICWDANRNGEFSVREAYVSLDDQHPIVPWHDSVWFKGHIPKHSFCLWIACLRRHPTQDRIGVWKHDPPDMKCSLCGNCPDSHSHLFFECAFASEVWLGICFQMEWNGFPTTWDEIVLALSDSSRAPKGLLQKLTIAASVYMIWKERNRRLFTNERRPYTQLIKDIRHVVKSRFAWKMRKKEKYLKNDAVSVT